MLWFRLPAHRGKARDRYRADSRAGSREQASREQGSREQGSREAGSREADYCP